MSDPEDTTAAASSASSPDPAASSTAPETHGNTWGAPPVLGSGPAEKPSRRSHKRRAASDDAGADQVREAVQEASDDGYVGVRVDPTPDHHYTVAGVLAGKPTPETDPALAAEQRAAR